MKVWTKVKIKDKNPQVDLISKAFINYLFLYGPLQQLCLKYHINSQDKLLLQEYTANRISGLLLLYLSKDIDRINDIANKYNVNTTLGMEITPEVEGYIEQ